MRSSHLSGHSRQALWTLLVLSWAVGAVGACQSEASDTDTQALADGTSNATATDAPGSAASGASAEGAQAANAAADTAAVGGTAGGGSTATAPPSAASSAADSGGSAGAAAQPSSAACDMSAAGCGMVAAGSSAAAGASASEAAAGADAAADEPAAARLPPVDSTDGMGNFDTMQDLATGPRGDSGVFWPSELGQGGVLHPIFVWGCGGGTTPTTYAELMSVIASFGFVVIAETSGIGDEGAPLEAAIDWMLAENEREGSQFYQKLDATKIGLGGHSIGSANAFLIADDPRLTTSIHVAGGSLDEAGNINAPTSGSGGKRLVHPVAYVCSESDQFGNVEKTEKDYEQTTAPAWMTVMTGVDHVGAAREGMPAIVAWLRWHLAGEEERRSAFLDPMGEFTTGMYVSKNKNW